MGMSFNADGLKRKLAEARKLPVVTILEHLETGATLEEAKAAVCKRLEDTGELPLPRNHPRWLATADYLFELRVASREIVMHAGPREAEVGATVAALLSELSGHSIADTLCDLQSVEVKCRDDARISTITISKLPESVEVAVSGAAGEQLTLSGAPSVRDSLRSAAAQIDSTH